MKEKKQISSFIFLFITIFYLDIITKINVTGSIFNIGILYTLIFTIPIIILLFILTRIFGRKLNKVLLFIFTLLLIIYSGAQIIHKALFSTPLSVYELVYTSQALDFIDILKGSLLHNALWILVILIPFILLIIFNKRIDTEKISLKKFIIMLLLFIVTYGISLASLIPNKKDNHSAYKLYYNLDDTNGIMNKFGVLTFGKVDVKRAIFGYKQIIIEENHNKKKEDPEEKVYGDNITDIDFASLTTDNQNIQTLNDYFSTSSPTNQTEYTGMFKGKNLIFILAEGFNEIAIDETRTPTLYNMIHTGFNFTNFYSPVYLSTTGGEFQATTGLYPTMETLNKWKSQKPLIYYGLGNVFQKQGYRAQSYHNWTYTYYARNKTMETLGFNNYLGCGNGLEDLLYPDHNYPSVYKCRWLEFDSDMAKVTTPLYMGQEGNFVTYYVTVSGHAPYIDENRNATYKNNIARRHWDYVTNLQLDNEIKNYLAAQIELDKFVEQLINDLTVSGELDNTVIALVGDHNPYDIDLSLINSVSTYEKDEVVERNHSNFILWNSKMEKPIVVDKVGEQIDVLPTLLNLFGIEYDSRLLVGKDILSDYEGLAIFSNGSWVSDYGTYYRETNKFVPRSDKILEEKEDEYISRMKSRVQNATTISNLIISTNYYSYLLKE